MAHSPSAEKRLRQNEVRRVRNKAQQSEIKTYLKRVQRALSEGSLGLAREDFTALQKRLDKAAGRKVLPRNRVNRIKSGLAGRIATLAKEQAKV